MPLPISLAHQLAERLAEVRHDGTLPLPAPGRQDPGLGALPRRRPVAIEKLLISTQHAEQRDARQILDDLWETVVVPILPDELYDAERAAPGLPRQPDGPLRDRRPGRRLRADGPQDHRRHLRRHGPPRRRRVQRQGPVEGRPQRGVRRALGRQEHRRRGPGGSLRGAGRLRDRRRASGVGDGRDVRDREGRHGRGSPQLVDEHFDLRPRRVPRGAATCTARSTRRPPRTATSAATTTTSPGSRPARPTRCARPPGSPSWFETEVEMTKTAPHGAEHRGRDAAAGRRPPRRQRAAGQRRGGVPAHGRRRSATGCAGCPTARRARARTGSCGSTRCSARGRSSRSARPATDTYRTLPKLRLRDGERRRRTSCFDNLGYADAAIASYRDVRAAQARRRHPGAHAASRSRLPTPLAPGQRVRRPRVPGAGRAGLRGARARRARARSWPPIPHDQLAVQWDTRLEFAMLEGVSAGVVRRGARRACSSACCASAGTSRRGVELGFHLCYGDETHGHFVVAARARASWSRSRTRWRRASAAR